LVHDQFLDECHHGSLGRLERRLIASGHDRPVTAAASNTLSASRLPCASEQYELRSARAAARVAKRDLQRRQAGSSE
jgi:hypothetical protein